jgi:hypothetical protein
VRGITQDELTTWYTSYKDIIPSAWLLPVELPVLRGFWANQFGPSGQSFYWYDQCMASQQNLACIHCTGAEIGMATTWPGALVPYIELDGTNDYCTIADSEQTSITAGLTFGGWVYFDAVNATQGFISKSLTTGDKRGYALYLDSTGVMKLLVSSDGFAVNSVTVTSAAAAATAWHFVVGRFEVNVSSSLFVDGTWVTVTAGALASIYDNARAFQIGQYDENASYRLKGRVAQAWLCAATVDDSRLSRIYKAQAPLFGHNA